MNKHWHKFLSQEGAVFNGNHVIHFGNPDEERQALTAGNILCDLSDWALLEARGNDAARFLHGQLTNDVLQLPGGHSQLNAYCTPQGRVRATMCLFYWRNSYFLQLPADIAQHTGEQLHKYILLAQVQLTDASTMWVRIGCAGSKTAQHLADMFSRIPARPNDMVVSDDVLILRIAGYVPRFEIIAEIDNARDIWSTLAVHASAVGPNAWRHLNILAGLADITPETVESFLPQDLNLDLIDGVSFHKGCFPGQEIIARLHHRGKAKRRLFRARLQCDPPPDPGERLVITDNRQEYATIANIEAAADAGCYDALLVMPALCQTGQIIPLESDRTIVATLSPLPCRDS